MLCSGHSSDNVVMTTKHLWLPTPVMLKTGPIEQSIMDQRGAHRGLTIPAERVGNTVISTQYTHV